MALAARTMLQARLTSAEKRPLPTAASPQKSGKHHLRDDQKVVHDPLEGGRVGVGYAVEFFPMGQEERHGPDLHLSWVRWPFQARLTIGYRFDLGRLDEQSRWSCEVLQIAPSLAYLRGLPHQLQLLVGLKAQMSLLFSNAQSLVDQRHEYDHTSELALGAQGGLIFRPWPRVWIEFIVGMNWIPLQYQLLVSGKEKISSGPLEFAILPSLHVKLF